MPAHAPGSTRARKPRMDYAAVVICLLWLAVLALWPWRASLAPRPNAGSGMEGLEASVRYARISGIPQSLIREPLLFLQYARTRAPEMRENVASYYYELTPDNRHEINLSASEALQPGPPALPGLGIADNGAGVAYTPVLSHRPAFAPVVQSGGMRVRMQALGALHKCGFRVKDPVSAPIELGDQAWQATLAVRCDDNGRPSEVFVLESTENSDLDRWLVQMCRQGTADPVRGGCSGRLVVFRGRD